MKITTTKQTKYYAKKNDQSNVRESEKNTMLVDDIFCST